MRTFIATGILSHIFERRIVVTIRTERKVLAERRTFVFNRERRQKFYFAVVIAGELHQFEFVQRTFQFFERLDQTTLRKIVRLLARFTMQTARPRFDQLHVTTTFAATKSIVRENVRDDW